MGDYKYCYCCVNPDDIDELDYITDNFINITYKTFIKHVDKNDFNLLKKV